MRTILGLAVAASLVLGLVASASAAAATNATYFNDAALPAAAAPNPRSSNAAALPAADPYVLHDERSGYYYAYSTDGADDGYHFGIYRSADLVTWEKVPGGALRADDPNQWANDWFWAPEVYYTRAPRRYFLFYSGRSDANAKRWFGFADFEEPCKIGVAVSRSPEG